MRAGGGGLHPPGVNRRPGGETPTGVRAPSGLEDMNARTWVALSHLLDDAVDVPAGCLRDRLQELGSERTFPTPSLAALLDLAGAPDQDPFLETLPRLRPSVVSSVVDDVCDIALGTPRRAGDHVGPYKLGRRLASGGQGSVWLAARSDGLIDRPVAIKLPHGVAHRPDLAEWIARERRILAGLNHPHIARLYDAGISTLGEPFLVLEYVEGVPITQHCLSRALDVPARLRLFQRVIGAVAHAHGRLVIHRDLKPNNVLVTGTDDVRLLDFGIASLLEPAAADPARRPTAASRAMTVPYASPEQIRHQPLGVATDIYSLGVMLYELLTGTLPYTPAHETDGAWEEAVLGQEPRRPSAAAAGAVARALRGDLDAILLKALRKEPSERYPTAAALGDDIDRYLRGLPVHARSESPVYRARTFVRRHRLAAATAAVVGLSLLVGAGVAVWQMREAQRQRDGARYSQQRAEAFGDFMQTLLLDAGDEGRPLTATELLDRGAAVLERQHGLPDRVAAYMRFEVSRLFLRFDRLEREAALLASSADAARRIGDTDLFAAARCAAAASLATHDHARAETAFREAQSALAAAVTQPGISRVDCARARARLLRAEGDLPGAIRAISSLLTVVQRDASVSESQRELLRSALAELYKATDRADEALRLSAQSLEKVRDSGRAGSMAELDALSKHAGHLYRAGEVLRAASLQEQVLVAVERRVPTVRPLGYRSDLGLSLIKLGRPERALTLMLADLSLAEQVRNAPAAAIIHLNVSRALAALGRLPEARGHLTAADTVWRANPTVFRRMLTESAIQNAALLQAEGRLAEAGTASDALLDTLGYPRRTDTPGVDRVLRLGAAVALQAGDAVKAERLATSALERSRRMARDERLSSDVGSAALTRARARAARGDRLSAREDAALAATALRQALGPAHPDTAAATSLLAELGSD